MASVTIDDVARLANVSIKTVSRVLNREPNVRPETRQRVLAAALELRYRPNINARSLAGARSYLLGIFFDNPSPGYIGDVQLGAIAKCRAESYHLMVEPVDLAHPNVAEEVSAMLATVRMDGVILTPPVTDHRAVMDVLDAAGTPFVRIAPDLDLERAPYVYMDDRRAAFEMTEHLIGLGHRDIAFVRGHPEHGASHHRFEGYEAALKAHRLDVRADRIAQGYFSFRSGIDAAEKLLAGPVKPTAVFASNDDMALGVISVANQMGLSVPSMLSVVGFDDAPTARFVWPSLTTVRQPMSDLAAAAADMLITRATAGEDGRPARRMLDFQIIVRESSAPPAVADPGVEKPLQGA